MKKAGIIFGAIVWFVFALGVVANASTPLKANRKHKAKFEVAAPQKVQHIKTDKQVSHLELNHKMNKKTVDKTDMDQANGGKSVDLKTRNHKLK